jgi:hypothetical protein
MLVALIGLLASFATASAMRGSHRAGVPMFARVGSSPPTQAFGAATARNRACQTTPSTPDYIINPADYGADPTGITDSTAVVQHCVELLWNASRLPGSLSSSASDQQLDLNGATLDLAGGVFLLSSPVVFPTTGARNFQVRGGTLRAARNFPVSGFLFELRYTSKSYVENAAFHDVVFDGGRGLRGGGLLSVDNLHMRVQGCWFLRFGTVGLSVRDGHEFYVDDTWASQATFAGLGTCGGNGTGIQLQQSDGSVTNSVIFCTKLGIHLNGGNVVLENLHVYNTGHYNYREDRKLMPFGAVWSHYATGIKIIGGYFDDCIVVLDNPKDVIIAASSWLLGGWNSEGGIVLRAVQGHGAPRPVLQRLSVTGSYMQRMPSFPSSLKKTQFVWFDGNQGKFNDSVMVDVVLADNLFDVPGLDVLVARATRARRSVRVANESSVQLDFSDELLFSSGNGMAGAMLASVQCSVVFDSATPVSYHTYQLASAPLTVMVSFAAEATALVTIDVDQSQYGLH